MGKLTILHTPTPGPAQAWYHGVVRSMTGYGRGVAERDGIRAVVEIRSVNHRFLDIKIRGSSLDPGLEKRLKGGIRDSCHRGSVSLSVRVERHGAAAAMRLDMDVARSVHADLQKLVATLDLGAPVTLELVCQQPGVWVPGDTDADAPRVSACVEEAVESALSGLLSMRATEGRSLDAEIVTRLGNLSEIVARVDSLASGAAQKAQTRVHERIAKLLASANAEVDEDRLAHEIAVLADKLDITEELVRLRAHIQHTTQILDESRANHNAVGRRLDFLIQEMGREINTVGSKSQSADIARAVVDAKAELEKVREQVQNIE